MKHLFIINPEAFEVKGHVGEIVKMISGFFNSYKHLDYTCHITRWSRDAVGFVHRYVSDEEDIVRVYAVGGSGTIFEVIGGVMGLPNVQVANIPMGMSNVLARYFGYNNINLFRSVRNLVFSDTIPLDVIRCGNHFALNFATIGLESEISRIGDIISQNLRLQSDLGYYAATAAIMLKNRTISQKYNVLIDGETVCSGEFTTILIAQNPYYAKTFFPAIDSRLDNGFFDVYMVTKMPKSTAISIISTYLKGHYEKLPAYVTHKRCKKLRISSDEVMSINIDGEAFFDSSIEFEVIPYALDFICPKGVDISNTPYLGAIKNKNNGR